MLMPESDVDPIRGAVKDAEVGQLDLSLVGIRPD